MSEENVETLRSAYELFNRYHEAKARHDNTAVDRAWESLKQLMVQDFEYREDPAWPGAGTYHGLENCRRVWEGYYDQLGQQVFVPERILDSGNRVVVILRWSAQGTASGAAAEMTHGHLHTLRGGRMAKWEVYFDPQQALEAAGLSE